MTPADLDTEIAEVLAAEALRDWEKADVLRRKLYERALRYVAENPDDAARVARIMLRLAD